MAPGSSRLQRQKDNGRGACSNQTGRFESQQRCDFDDGWGTGLDLQTGSEHDCQTVKLATKTIKEQARSIINKVNSPDISFDRSINIYRGCEHGCIYCFARPTHCYLGFSAGLDFETQLIVKENAPDLLRRELARPGYRPRMIALGTNTDPYQPIERHFGLTREILKILSACGHPVGIVTKSAGVLRDLDILQSMAERGLVRVAISVTTLNRQLARKMEPRASTPRKRIEALRRLSDAGVPTTVMVAPVIPALNDSEIECLLEAAADAGVSSASYILLRLPLEVADLFKAWLQVHYPDRRDRVLSLLRDMRGGGDYRAEWGLRMRGSGPFAELIAQRFRKTIRKLGLNSEKTALRTDLFQPPVSSSEHAAAGSQGEQLDLFAKL